MRTVTPVVRAGRAAAGAAVAAGMLFGGAAAATADGEADAVTADVQADAAAAPAVIVPAAVEPVNIPAVDAAAETEAAGVVTLEAPALTVTVPEPEPEVVEAPEEDAEQAENSSEDATDESEESTSDSEDSSSDSESSRSEESGSEESSSRSDSEESSDSQDESSSESEESSSESEEKEESAPAPSAAKGSSILSTARSGIGVPYVWGGDDPSGWDCSGFVQWVYAQHGISLPHSAGAQVAQGTKISRSEARPGDLVYKPGHIGIYAGNGQFVDAGNPRVDTTERDIYSGDWSYYRIG